MTTIHARLAMPQIPWLPPTLRRLWRSRGSLQIGLDPARAVVLANVSEQAARLLRRLDGSRTLEEILADQSLADGEAETVLRPLASAGLLVDLARHSDDLPTAAHQPPRSGALAPEIHGRSLGTLAASPVDILRARAAAQVVVIGESRLGLALSSILAASGLHRIGLVHSGRVSANDCVPGGPAADTIGKSRLEAIGEAVGRTSPQASVSTIDASDRPSVVVLAEPAEPQSDRTRMLMQAGTPFIAATIRERRGVVGPFVIPGESSCLACQEATRTELDPEWPGIRAQLLAQAPHPAEGGEATLVMLTASLVATQVLQWIDSERLPETINAAIEIALPDLVLERRYWPRHRSCACRID